MDNIIIKPKNKTELELVNLFIKKNKLKSTIQRKELLKKQKAKKEFLDSLPARFEEVKQHLEGKLELKNARELLNEL